jgi:LuxR family maltose regulon positive regulatory protein
VLGGRFDPPLSLPRLRLAGRVCDVRAADLVFTDGEARALLVGQDVRLPDDSIDLLLQRTEGWPAALRLAVLSLSDEPEPEAFVATFAGDQRGVADYLVAEVLSRLPDDLRDFLVITAVVEEVTVDLAAALTGRGDAGAVLDRLERGNALVTRLGRGRQWYRYHTLLRSFLLAQLQRRDTRAARALHTIASDWFAAADLPDLALEHAATANDEVRVLALLRRFALRQLLSGSGTTVRQVLQTGPAKVRASAEAALIGAIAALEHGELSVAERLIDGVGTPDPDDSWLIGLRDAAELYRARMRGDLEVLDDGRYEGRPTHADGDEDVALLVLTSRGALRIAAGEYEDARADAAEALDIARRSGRDYLALQCMNQLSAIAGALSELPTTKGEAQRAISFAAARGWGSSPRMAYAYTLAAWAAYQSLDLAAATRWASSAVGVIDGAMTPEVENAARFAEAVIAFDRSPDRRAALDRLRHTWSTAAAVTPSPALAAYAGMAELHMCLALGDQPRARGAVERIERVLGRGGDAAAMRALLLLRRNHDARARRALDPLLRGDAPAVVVSNLVTGWLVEAVAATHADEPQAAHTALSTALALAEPIAALRPFYDLGDAVRVLLIGATGRLGAHERFAADLLEAWGAARAWQDAQAAEARSGHTAPRASLGLASLQPLTMRELEVLRDLPSMLTTEEIAEAHVVSVNTIKTHLKSIYRKLEVNSRRDAVEVGRLAGIL